METTKKIYAPDELVCAVAIHPGEMLRDELQARGMSQRKFAGIIGMPYTAFNEIINGKRSITTDTALKIEAATGIAATLWLGLQADYNMQTARRDNKLSAILENIRNFLYTQSGSCVKFNWYILNVTKIRFGSYISSYVYW